MKKKVLLLVEVDYPAFWADGIVNIEKYTREDVEVAISDYQSNEDGRNSFCHAKVKVKVMPC